MQDVQNSVDVSYEALSLEEWKQAIEDLAEDTYSQPGRFFSYRRATHRGEPTNGRQLSVIALPA